MHNHLRASAAVALLAVLLFCGAAASKAVAAVPPGPAVVAQTTSGRGGSRFGQMLLSLGLSDPQKAQIRSIMDKARQQSEGADRDTRRKTFRAAFEKIDAVLTPAQRDQLHKKLQAAREARQSQGTSR